MSRCFPYPPPGYCQNGATNEALIESIKKETVKAVKDKSERKKEKREKKERKEKKREEKRNVKLKQAIQKNPSEFQPEACFEKTKSKTVAELETEHLEKSDLTVELGEPTTSQKPSYSSDCTQNSNKRKRVSVPDGSSGLGKFIKIRLLKKHKPDSDREILCTSSGISDTRLTGADERLNLISSNRTAGVPATSGRENIPAAHGHLLSHTTSTPSFERHITKSNDLQGFAPGPARLPLTHLRHDTPSFNSNKTHVPVPVPVPPISSAVPDYIVSTRNEKQNGNTNTEIPQKASLTRHEKKRQKKFSKYEKLIGRWVPPEAPQLPVVEEDWLSRRGLEVMPSSRDNVETRRELPQSSLWQPCARYLVETDIYALPYTVPF